MCQMLPGLAAEPVYDASEYAGAGENDELGVWTWRGKWNGKNNLTRDGNYALLPATVDVAFPPGSKENQPGWGMDTASATGSYLPSVWRFLGPEPLESFVMKGISYQARPGVLLAHPGGARLVAATWRAPRTGVISLAAQFQDAATGPARSDSGISWFIQLRKEKPLASGDLAAGGTSALLQRTGLSVEEGDLLHFAIDPRGSFTNDTTSLLARVSYGPTAAPDPARTLDAPPPTPFAGGGAALRTLPGGDQTLRYGGGANDFVVLAGGSNVVDWPITSGGVVTNYVASGILAYDQALRYDLSGATVVLKGGTVVSFFYGSSSDPAVPGYVTSGTLSSTAAAQTLPYGYLAGYSMAFLPGSSISISLYQTPGVAAQGFVKNGKAATAQPVYFSYLAGGTLTVQAGSSCDFHHSPTAGTAQIGYLKSGTPAADTYLPYSYTAANTVKVRAGTTVTFAQFKSAGPATAGYVSTASLAENSLLYYGTGSTVTATADTPVLFAFSTPNPASLVASYGFVSSCRLSSTQSLRYGSQATATVPILGGTVPQFSRLSSTSQSGYLDSGILGSPGPHSLLYSISTPVRSASIQGETPAIFARISATNGNGYLVSGILGNATPTQTIYKPNGTTVVASSSSTLVTAIPVSGSGTVEVLPPVAPGDPLLDSDGDGMPDVFEIAYQLNRFSYSDATGDADSDGLSNLWEYRLGTNPRNSDSNSNGILDGAEDTDNDGLTNSYETNTSLTNPALSDTDRDGLPDGWEVQNNFNPNSGAGTGEAAADSDGDGLNNLSEFLNGTSPLKGDTDLDGTSDLVEVNQASNPTNASDAGQAPSGPVKDVVFSLGGDYASWRMQIKAIGPGDERELLVITPTPGQALERPVKLRIGSAYEVRLIHTGTIAGQGTEKWYCRQAQIDGLPGGSTFLDYSNTRRAGVDEFFTVGGGSWLVDNRSGLLSAHSHHKESSGGNPALGLKATLLPVELQSVTFSGSGTSEFFTVKADDGPDFAVPHWKDTGGDGNLVKTDGDHTHPVAFVRNKIPQVAATIKLTPGLAGVRVKASNTDGFSMTTTPLTVPASGIVEIPATSLTQPLPNTVFHYPAFKLTWEISINGGAWSRIGESKNPLYVLRRAPLLGVDELPGAVALTQMRYTLVHTSCTLATGETVDDAIVSAVNTHFIIWNAKRLRYDAQKGIAPGAPEPIYYYKNWETTDRSNDILRINTLLSRPQGGTLPSCQCYVFAEMLRDMLKIQGIPATAPVIVYDWDGDIAFRRFLVKHWTFSGTGTSGVVGWPYKQDAPIEYEYIGGTVGQNNEHCPGVFDNHCLLGLADGRFYDPSYGSGPYQNLTAHDWAAFSGYERIQNGLLDPPSAARKNTEGFGDTRAYSYR